MNEDLLVQLVADHYMAVDPKISNKQLVEKFNWAKDNIEQFSNEIYKREKGQPIDKRNLDLIAEKLGTKVDYSKVPGMSYVGNVNSKVIKAKNEYDRLSDESPLPEQYTPEEFNAAVEKEKSSMLINKVPFGLGYAFSDKTPADVDKEAKKAVADKHTKLINAKKEYEALRPTIETDKVISIEDIYRDAKRDVRAKDIADNAKNEVLPAMHIGAKVNSLLFNDKKNDLSEISVNMKKKADAYLNVLQQNITDSFIKIKDENERHLAAEMLTGKIDNYDPNGQYSAELESYVDQLTKLTSQQKEFAKIYNAPKTGKSYDDVVRDRYVAEAKKADQGNGNSLVGAWAGTVKEGWKSLTRIIGDNLTFDDGEKVLNELDKGGQFTDKQIQVLNNYNLQQSINQIEKISSTARKSDWGSPLLINTAVVDGYTLVVDDKKQFQYITGPDGKTVHSPNEKQMAAIQKFNQNPSAYQVVHGWTATPFKAATNLVGETIAQMIPMIAAGAVATAAAPGTGGASLGAFAGTATMFAQQYGSYYDEELQRSGDAGKAGQYAAIMAGVESVAEVLGGAVEMKLAKSLAGKSGKNVIMDAARRTADEAAAAKNVAGFSFVKAFTGNLSKDIGQEYAEEFGTLFAQSGVNAIFGNESDITANELISTVVATPFATAALSAIPSYQTAKDSYKETLMAAAANPTAFVDNMAIMVESGRVPQDEAKTKVSMVNKLADRNKEYNDFVRDNKISLTKQEGDKLESLIFDEVFSMAKKPKDNSEKINALLNSAKQRSFEERAEEPAPERIDVTPADVVDAEFEEILAPDQPEVENTSTSTVMTDNLSVKSGVSIDSDGTWFWDIAGNATPDVRGKNTIHLNREYPISTTDRILNLFSKNSISALIDTARSDNRHTGKMEIHFETVDDAKKAHGLMIQAGLVGENALGDLVGHELEGNMVFTQGNFMNRDIAKHIVENAVKNEDGSFTAPDMITGEDFAFPAEKMAAYEQIYRGSKNAWETEPGAIVGGQQNPGEPAEDVGQRAFTAPANNTSNSITAVPGNRGTENTRSGVNTVLDFLVNGPRQVVYEGKLATLSMDEGGKVELNQTGLVKELGNIVEVGDTSISQFGINPMPTAGITDQNTIRIGDNLYVNRYSDPMSAIDFEGDSPVVDLERIITTGGYQNKRTSVRYKKVVLTGAEAEIAASLITNAALAANPVLAQEMNDFVRNMPEYEKIDQEAKGYDADPEEVFDVEVKQSVVDYLLKNFEGIPETVYAMAELFSLIAERMSRTFPDQYPTAVDYIKQKMVGFGEPNLTFEILNQFLDGAIETTNNDNVKAELQDIKSFLDANRSAFIVQPELPTAEPASTEQQPEQPAAEPTPNADVVPEAVPGGNELQVLGEDKKADVESEKKDNKNAITKEIIIEKLDINNPFYKKVEDALVKLGLIEKYNPETRTGDVIGGYVQKTSDGGFSVGKMIFSKYGSVSYIDGDIKVSFDKDGNVISENTKEAKQKSINLEIEAKKETIVDFEKTRDSESFKYKEVTETDLLGNKKKVKKLKTPQELKESTDKINKYIQKLKSEISELENKELGSDEIIDQEIKPIGQLGTGANIYFEVPQRYRVNDAIQDGGYYLLMTYSGEDTPFYTENYKDKNEAVFIAKSISNELPDGLIRGYHDVDAIVSNLRKEYSDLKNNSNSNKAISPLLFPEPVLSGFDQNVQDFLFDTLNNGKEESDRYVVKSVEDFVKNSAPFTFLSGLKLVTIVNPKTKNQLYQVFDKNGKVPPGVRPNFIFSPKVIYDELISYLKNDIKRFFDNWNLPDPTFMKDVFDNPGSKSLSDLLDPVHSSEFLGAQIFEINEKIKKSGGIEKAPKRLIEKSNEFGYYLVNYQDLLLSELTNSLFDLAIKLGYLTANDSDKFNSFTEEYFEYFTDGRYMENVYNDLSVLDYAKQIFDEYFGKPAGGVGQVVESDGGQVSIQERQASASEEVQSGARPDSGGRAETATPILKVPESIIDDGIDNAGLPNELRTDLITTGDPNFDSILNDFKAAFDEWAGNTPGDEPVMKSKDDTKLLSMGAKLMDMYVAQGKTKFEDILADLSQKMGTQSPEFLTAMKKVYVSSMISNPSLNSSFEDVRNFTYETPKPQDNGNNRTEVGQSNSQESEINSSDNAENIPGGDGGNRGGLDERSTPEEILSGDLSGSESDKELFAPVFGKQRNNVVFTGFQGSLFEDENTGIVDGRGDSVASGKRTETRKGRSGKVLPDTSRGDVKQDFRSEVDLIPIEIGSIENIRETLPYLFPEQHDDVLKAEKRFFDPDHISDFERGNGKGMLFTNGTGTGKTFTGLGIAKRFYNSGKKNILIVTPSQPKVNDWSNDAKHVGLNVVPLDGTSDGGSEVNVTTFANFRANDALMSREFDLIIYDESHRLLEDKKGDTSSTTVAHYKLANKDDFSAFARITHNHPLWKKRTELFSLYKEEKDPIVKDRISKQIDDLNEKIDSVTPRLKEQAADSVQKTKVVFLSATPFKAHFNLRYVNGFLFNWGDKEIVNNRGSRVDAESQFYLKHFGSAYQWKYHRLQTREKSNPDAVAMQEVEFSEKLMKDGVMSGRMIDSEMDYSREFPLVTGFNSEFFNRAFSDIYNYDPETQKYHLLSNAASEVFYDYNYSTQLFESIKASVTIPRIQKHLDLGRKVVIFHRRKQANSTPPFASILNKTRVNANEVLDSEDSIAEEKERALEMLSQADQFEVEYSELLKYESNLNYDSAIDQIKSEFGDKVVLINGDITPKNKNAAIKSFNTDNSGVDIILVQEEAGKEGISFHDVTGTHQRVLISLLPPVSTTTGLQIEGRIYRLGQKSNAVFEYPLLGLDMEVAYFGNNINKRLSTTENLAMGNLARDLIRSYSEGVLFNSVSKDPDNDQGTGGKEYDKKIGSNVSLFDKAKLVYSTNQKQSGRRDQREGEDYFATPEPVGQKMVEFADIMMGESALEPSAGHGAIAMWFDLGNNVTAIEPSFSLYSKLTSRSGGGTKKIINGTFESLNIINKFDAVVMNPPFGKGGSTAMAHLEKAFIHLREKGRIVALIPRGSMDGKLEKFLYGSNEKGKLFNPDAKLVAEIILPSSTFEQAGTSVNTRIVVIDKGNQTDFPTKTYDFSDAKNINDLFNKIENVSIPPRDISEDKRNENFNEDNEESNVEQNIPDPVNKPTEYVNTKSNEKMSLVTMNGYQGKDFFNKANKFAKSNNGYYSSYAKGFLFKKEEDANTFYEKVLNPDVMKSIIGPKSMIFSDAKYKEYSRALEMEAQGLHPAKIKIFTGWEKGADGKWRYEISDPVVADPEAMFASLEPAFVSDNPVVMTVGEIFSDHELFKYYPALKNVKVEFGPLSGGKSMSYDVKGRAIKVNTGVYFMDYLAKNPVNINKGLLHEITHYVQISEGFNVGGSADMFRDVPASKADAIAKMQEMEAGKKTTIEELYREINANILIEKLLKLPEWISDNHQRYLALAGEVEARAVEDRFGFSTLKRRASFLNNQANKSMILTEPGNEMSMASQQNSILEEAKTRIIKALLLENDVDVAKSGLFKVFESDLTDQERQVFIDDYNKVFADQVVDYNFDVSEYAATLWGKFINSPESVTSAPLKALLERFSQWMVDLYDSFTDSRGRTAKVEVSPEVRELFENIIVNGNIKRFQKVDLANSDAGGQRIFARKAKFRTRQTEDGGDARPGYAQREAESNEIKFSGGAIPGQGGSNQGNGGSKNNPRPTRFKSASGTWYRWDAGAGRWRTSIADANGNFTDRNILSDKRNSEVEAEFVKSRVTMDNVASNEDVIFNGTKNRASNLSGAMFISPRNIATLNLPARLYSLLNTVNLADVKVRIYDNGGDYKAAVEANRNNAVSRQRSLSPDEMTSIGEINVNKIADVKGVVKNTILKYNYIDVVGFDIQEQSDIAEIHKLVNNPAVPKTKLVFFDGNGVPQSMHMVGIGSMNHNEHVSSIIDANPGKKFAIVYETNGVGNESKYVETASSLFKMRPDYLGRVHVNGLNEVKNDAGIDYAAVKAMDSKDFVAYMDGSKIVDFQYTNSPDKGRQYIQSTTDGRDYVTDGNFTGGMEENLQAAQNVIFRDKATAAFAGGIVHINGAGFDIYDVELAVLRAIANLDPDKFTSELIENLRKSDYISRKYAFPDMFDETETTEGPGSMAQEDASKVTPPSQELVAKYQNAKKYYGKDKMVILPDGTRVRGRYVLVDAYDMSTSHDETTFTDTPGFPTDNGKNSNDRNYKDDVSAQGAVITAGNHFDERAIDAPPVLSSEGIVLSGNNRTMSARLGAAKNTNKKYMAALPEVLTEKSISGDLSGMRAPMLAIELYDQVPYTTGVFARFNKEEKKSKTTEDTMQSIKSFVNDALAGEIGQRIAEFDNISQFFDRDATWVISKLIQNGIIDKFRVTEFADIARDNTYSLKDSGKQLVRNILLSSILDTDLIERVREEGLKELFNKVSSASKLFLENKTTQEEYNMIQDLNDGIRLFIDYKRNKSMNTIANVVKATDIFDATFSQDYTTEAILMAMYLDGPETQLKEFVGAVNTAIQGNMANSLFSDIQEQLTKTDIYGRYIDMKLEKLNAIIAGKYPKDVKDKAATDAALLNDIKKIGFGQTYKAAVVGGVLKSKAGNNNLKTLSRLYSDVVSGKDADLANAFNAAVKRSLDAFGYGAVTNYAVKAGIKDLYGVFLGKKIDMSSLSDGVLQNIGDMAKSGMIALTPLELYRQFSEKFAAYGITPGDIATAMDLPLQDVTTRNMSSDEIAELGLPDQVENPYDFYRGLGMADNTAEFAKNIYDSLPEDYNKTATALMIIADMNDYHDKFEIVHYAPSTQELPEDAAVKFANEVYSYPGTILSVLVNSDVDSFVNQIVRSAINSNYPLPLLYEQYAYKAGLYVYESGSMIVDEEGDVHQVVGSHYTDVVTTSNEIVSPVSKTDPIQGIATKVASATGVPVVLLPGDKFASEYKKYGANALLFTDTVNRRIVANADAITSKELFHEGAHVAVINYFLDNRDALPAFHRAIAAVLQNGTIEERVLAQRVSDWADQYTQGDAIDAKLPLDVLRAHEFFAELIALLAENSAQITKPTEAGIVQAIKNLLSRIFGIDFDIELNDLNDVIDFINGVAQNLTIGKPESAVFQSKSAKTITTDSVMKAKDNNIFGNNGTQVKIYTYDNRGVNLYLEGKVMSQGRDDNGDRTVQIMNSAGEIENYLYDQFHSLTRNGEKFIVISGYAQDIKDKYHTPSQLRKLDKIVGALFKDPTLDVHSIYTTYKKDFAKNGLTMGAVRAAVENSRSEDRGEQVKDFMNDPQVSDYVKRRLLFLGKNVIGDILANANAFKKSGITNEEIQIYIQNLLASANTPDELYAIFDQLKAQKIDFVNDGFFSKVYAMAIIEIARRVRSAEDLTFGFIPSRLAEIVMEEQLVASAGSGFMQGVQKNTSDDIYSTKELNKVWTHLNSLNTEELKNFNQDGRSLYDIINEMAEEVKFSDDEVDEMTNDESVWDILRRMFDENKLDTEFLKNLYDEYFGTTADESVMKSVVSNDVHKEIIQKLFKKFGDDKFAIMANYRAIIEMRYPGIDFDQYMSDNPFVTQLLAKEYARMSINSFKKTFSSNLDPSIAAVLSRAYKKNISEDDTDMAKDPVSKLEELFSKKDVTIIALQEMLAEVDDKLSFSTNPDTLLNYRNSLYQTIESLKTESGQFTGATENQFLNAITFGINKLDKGQLESMGYAIPTDAKPSDYASIIMKHLVRQSAAQLNVSVNGMARLFVTKMGLTEPQATELATAINEVYLKKIMETKKALVKQKLKTVIKDDKKRVSLMDRMIDTLLLGDISDARFAEAFADKFNLKYFDTDDLGYINKLLDIWNDPMASPRDRQNAYRLIKSKIAESTESRASTILGMIKSLNFIALLSGFNTAIRSFVSSFASNIAMDVTMTAQLARRGHYGTYKEYKNKNRDLFGFNPLEYAYSLVQGKPKKEILHSAGVAAAIDAMLYGVGNISTSDTPDESFSKFDVILNEYTSKLASVFGRESKISGVVDKKSPRERIAGAIVAIILGGPILMVRTLGAMDVMMNTSSYEKAAFIEAIDAAHAEVGNTKSDEFFRVLHEKMGKSDLPSGFSTAGMSALDIATIKKRRALESREQKTRDLATQRVLTGMVINSNVGGLFTGLTSGLLTFAKNNANSAKDPYSKVLWQAIDTFMIVPFFPIVKTVMNTVYLGYQYSPLSVPVNSLLKAVSGIDKIQYDVSSGRILLNGLTLSEIKGSTKNSLFSVLFDKNSAGRKRLADNAGTKAEFEAMVINSITGTAIGLMTLLYFFDLEEDKDGMYLVKDNEAWENFKVFAAGVLFDPEYDEKTKKREYSGQPFIDNKRVNGDEFKENNAFIYGWHFNWTDMPMAPTLGTIGILGDKMKYQRISFADAAAYSTLGSMQYHFGEGFAIGLNQLSTIFTAIGAKGTKNEKAATNELAKMIGKNIASRAVPNLYRQSYQAKRGLFKEPSIKITGESFYDVMQSAYTRDIPFFDKVASTDITGNPYEQNFDTYFIPDAFEQHVSDLVAKQDQNAASKIINDKDVDKSVLYKTRGQALRTDKKYKIPEGAKDQLHQKWGELYRDLVDNNRSELIGMNKEERQAFLEEMARSVKDFVEYQQLKDSLKVELTAEELKELEKKSTSKKGKPSKVKDEFDQLLEQQNKK